MEVRFTFVCSVVSDSVTPWTVACQAHLSGILQARILEWVAIPSPGDLPDPGIEPRSPALQADSLPLNHQGRSHNGTMDRHISFKNVLF